MNFGTIAIPCGMRYHPVIVAQAGATLAQMFPGRMKWIAARSGEALNDMVVSAHWPEKTLRNANLKEGIEIIRRLWNHESVTKTNGYHYTKEARIWSLPEEPFMIFGAALSSIPGRLCRWVGNRLSKDKCVRMGSRLVSWHRC
jgi:alkanesulfonate monooxygenase SsuD/methylene tetrahydromethanopterin reductase-like flavin-dependent oxidoreductase (luciferase family)